MTDEELKSRIVQAKMRFGKELCILGHYYQCDDVIEFADYEGDSYQLAKAGASTDASLIVFCGVHFMAEASVILARPGQRVFLPDMDAGCPLADMADIEQVEAAWGFLEAEGVADGFLPVTYMNSSAALKAFCGHHDGTVCTSSSAGAAFDWALKQGRKIFFFPDENLGKNAALACGIKGTEVVLWNPNEQGGGIDARELRDCRVIVWKGFCHVHTHFTVQQVNEVRGKYPGCRVVVHPECIPQVVALSDGNGSTAYLKKYVEEAPAGSTIVVGTEINMVSRLARRHPNKKVLPLARSLCPNMFKISLADLCWSLEKLGEVNEMHVAADVARDAKVALDRMLSLDFD